MAEIKEQVEVEFENIQQVLSNLPQENAQQNLSVLEIAGMATLIHNFYNGMENVIKQLIRYNKLEFPIGPSWHRDLLQVALTSEIVTHETVNKLKPYLGFRNFFVHGYAFQIEQEKIQPLVNQANVLFDSFKKEIAAYLEEL